MEIIFFKKHQSNSKNFFSWQTVIDKLSPTFTNKHVSHTYSTYERLSDIDVPNLMYFGAKLNSNGRKFSKFGLLIDTGHGSSRFFTTRIFNRTHSKLAKERLNS